MKLPYTVFSADPVTVYREVEVEGEKMIAQTPGIAVQLVPEFPGQQGTITLNLTQTQAGEGHPFREGERVMVSFEVED